MWFKNLITYRLPTNWNMSAADLEAALSQRTLQLCGAIDMATRGWVASSPAGRLVHAVGGHYLIALGIEEKILPAAAVKQVVAARAAVVAEEQGYPVGRRQMRELKERVTDELRARALTVKRTTRAWIDPEQGWLMVDASSGGRADELLETLRDTLGSLPVRFLETANTPAACMSAWLTVGEAPLGFTIDQDLELQSLDKSRSVVRYARHSLEGSDVRRHLENGKQVAKLGLTWRDRVAFVLTDKLQVKRIEFLEISKQPEPEEQVSEIEMFEADFLLMAGSLRDMLGELTQALGGMQLVLGEVAAKEPRKEAGAVDTLYDRAVHLVGAGEGGSVTPKHLQNGFGIGYNRACLLLDVMEGEGIVGAAEPGGERHIFTPAERVMRASQAAGVRH